MRSLEASLFLVLVLASAPLRAQEKTSSQKNKGAAAAHGPEPALVSDQSRQAAEPALSEKPSTAQRDQAATGAPSEGQNGATRQDERRFSSAGKRDPFRPFNLNIRATVRRRENLSPLERYELGQLKLVGIIWNSKTPTAMVEDAAGLGYTVKVGTPIGASDGIVKSIKPNEIVVEEFFIDLYGARKRREVNMRISAEKAE